jgi:hypothetical protein
MTYLENWRRGGQTSFCLGAKGGDLALLNLIQPTISLEMPVPSQGHYVFKVFRFLTDFENYVGGPACE